MKIDADFTNLAKTICFSSTSIAEIYDNGYQLRQGKTDQDVLKAVKKGMSEGRGKTEVELEMVAFRLSMVFKKQLSLTPMVIKDAAISIKNELERNPVCKTSSPKRYKTLLSNAKTLAKQIVNSDDITHDEKVATLALDIVATRHGITLPYKDA